MRQVVACPGQCASRTRIIVAFALALLLAPLAALAAPYADYVIDVRTGEVLHQENANTRLHPASLTKMMTLYIAFEAIERGEISLDSKVTISRHAAAQPPSKLGLKPGQTIALRYLIRAAAIKSANDAATAIGEAIEGSESAFAKRMNRTARALGMARTNFVNANGLTAKGHLSTAHDMTVLGRHLFYDYPQYYNIFSRTSADAGVAQVASTNRRFLAAYEGADGIKTGYTQAAGFNLVASAHRGNKHVIATVFGGKSTADRNARAAKLLDLGFGRSPNRATVQKPAHPAYSGTEYADATDQAASDEMAEAIARAVTTAPDAVAAGKTIRLNVAVAQSPRPRARPLPGTEGPVAPASEPVEEPAEELLLAMQDDIAAALAEAQVAAADAPEAAVAEPAAAGPAAEPAAEPAAGPVTGPETSPAFAQTTAPQPETALALADPAAAAEGAAPVAPAPVAPAPVALASILAPLARTAPPAAPRPADAAAAAPDAAVTLAVAEAAPESTEVAAALAAVPAVVTAGPATTAIDPEAGATLAAAAEAGELLAVQAATADTPAPKSRPEQIVLAAVTTTAPAPEELEVVTRVSTSGGRQWAINVGHFGSRYDAERQLLQTALVEMSTLEEALRKVVSRRGGFDANFVGMTEEMASLACRRLQARQAECTVVGP